MSKVKNQHYVPQFYLKKFAVNDYIYVFDKTLGTQLSMKGTNIKNIASERYFYDLPIDLLPKELQDKVDIQFVEKSLSKIEADFHQTLNNIISRYTLPISESIQSLTAISEDEKLDLSMFLAIQDTRTRDFRNSTLEAEEKGVRELINRFGKKAKPLIEKEFEYFKVGKVGKKKKGKERKFELVIDEQRRKQITQYEHIKHLIDLDYIRELAKILTRHIWLIGVNRSSIPLYTSDNPLVRKSWKREHFFSNTGFASEGIEIAFPITPKLLLILCERGFHSYAEIFEQKYVDLQTENVKYYNSLQVFNSNRQIYSINNDFDLALDIFLNHPESRVRNRWNLE